MTGPQLPRQALQRYLHNAQKQYYMSQASVGPAYWLLEAQQHAVPAPGARS